MNGEDKPSSRSEAGENRATIAAQVGEIVAEIAEKPLPEKNTVLTSLGIDSMAKLDILAILEERFDVLLNESMVEEFHTVGHIAQIVAEAIRSTASR